MSIDWTKAPEGATHYQPESRGFHAAWFRLQGGKAREMWVVIPGCALEHIIDPTAFDESMQNLIARPAEPANWNGQGLPPVGTNCEYRSNDRWLQCEVVAHRNNAAVVLNPHYEADFVPPQDLRPIRTPEQIANDAREKAIDAMLALDPPHESGFGMTSRRQFCEILFDAGYRRQEEGK
ncbi:TPA: hypothetical protein NIH82_005334 [Pseudomonas aeruginosa]|nr:hypothetical protein [Pseudomonas aeruginosa]HCF6144429.1 hypothetical protein [Pseudomonas aeruginosa]